jgi:inorganic pyrophosphatase
MSGSASLDLQKRVWPTWPDFALEERVNASTRQHCKLDFDPNLRVFTLAKPLMAGLTTGGFIPID